MATDNENGSPSSVMACYMCRKRKIKCSRELPSCAICERSSQPCSYPSRAGRPGPKIGSTQAPRKRHRPSVEEDDPRGRNKHRLDLQQREQDSSDNESTNLSGPLPDTSMSSASSYRQIQEMQSLSFIVHPSHESCSPEDAQERQDAYPGSASVAVRRPAVLATTCLALKTNLDLLDRL